MRLAEPSRGSNYHAFTVELLILSIRTLNERLTGA